jgi:formylglycine-generating enzyme required for sulfatase activity
MAGNVGELLQDRRYDSYNGAPADGSAWEDGVGDPDPDDRRARGGSYGHIHNEVWINNRRRDHVGPDGRYSFIGFRLARDAR